jgi:hypothetical protein
MGVQAMKVLPNRRRPKPRLDPEEQLLEDAHREEKAMRHFRRLLLAADEARLERREKLARRGLAGSLVVATVLFLAYGCTSSLRRTASAAAEIIDRQETLSPPDKTPSRPIVIELEYVFTVDGQPYPGTAKRGTHDRLSDVKVCYDPRDPHGNHRLEAADYSCGSFDPLNPGDG